MTGVSHHLVPKPDDFDAAPKSYGGDERERERRRETAIITAALMTFARPRRRSGDDWQTAVKRTHVLPSCFAAISRWWEVGAADVSDNRESADLFADLSEIKSLRDRITDPLMAPPSQKGHATPRPLNFVNFRENFQGARSHFIFRIFRRSE